MIDATDLANPADHPMQKAARAVKDILPEGHGFIILSSPYRYSKDAPDVQADYVSNVNREDAIVILKTLLFRWGINEQWMTKAQ